MDPSLAPLPHLPFPQRLLVARVGLWWSILTLKGGSRPEWPTVCWRGLLVTTFRRIRGLAELYICRHELEVTSGIFKIILWAMCRCRGRQKSGILCRHTYSDCNTVVFPVLRGRRTCWLCVIWGGRWWPPGPVGSLEGHSCGKGSATQFPRVCIAFHHLLHSMVRVLGGWNL